MKTRKRVLMACPHGFCAGVCRAVDAADAALLKFTPPIYCFNEIVHNRHVVDNLAGRGIVFVRDLDRVPSGAVLLFSAHGVTPTLRDEAGQRGLTVIDATCPFVTKVHSEVKRYARDGYTVILVGTRGHDEVTGVAGEAPDHVMIVECAEDARHVEVPDAARVAVVTQTTLSLAETAEVFAVLAGRFPALVMPPRSDICYATTNRQEAAGRIAEEADLVLVLGSAGSANTKRLVEVVQRAGTAAELVDDIDCMAGLDLSEVVTVGLTAGASTPESFVKQVLDALADTGFDTVETVQVAEESVNFAPPPPLRQA